MTDQHQFDRQKFKAAIHHICETVQPAELGKVKLHKILYFADMLHYLEFGRPLTGAEYQKQQFGPVAKHLTWALDELAREGRIKIKTVQLFGIRKQEYHVLSGNTGDLLNEHETALLDEVGAFVCGHSARAISDLSHNAAWESAEMGETLPYFTAFLMVPCEVTDEDVAWGNREAAAIFARA